jgi:hypothetical protein
LNAGSAAWVGRQNKAAIIADVKLLTEGGLQRSAFNRRELKNSLEIRAWHAKLRTLARGLNRSNPNVPPHEFPEE